MAASQSSKKLTEAVHFVCKKMALQPDKLGAVKLQKIIWYFDVRSFRSTGSTATGTVFVKGQHGPYTRDIGAVVKQLVAERRLFTDTTDYYDNEKARFVGKGETNRSVFSARELAWLEETTTDICQNHTAESISERSHGPVWRIAQFGEVIPFEATAVAIRRPSKEALELAKKDLELAL